MMKSKLILSSTLLLAVASPAFADSTPLMQTYDCQLVTQQTGLPDGTATRLQIFQDVGGALHSDAQTPSDASLVLTVPTGQFEYPGTFVGGLFPLPNAQGVITVKSDGQVAFTLDLKIQKDKAAVTLTSGQVKVKYECKDTFSAGVFNDGQH